MKKFFMLTLAFCATLFAERTVTLTWEDLVNPPETTYTIYKSQGSCQDATVFAPVASNITVFTYSEQSVKPGMYCYFATANLNAIESLPSNKAEAKVRPNPPTKVQVEVK